LRMRIFCKFRVVLLFFWANAERICSKDYLPTNEDIIRCKLRTTGVQEITFVSEEIKFNLVDVGGQRSERRKWLSSFGGVKAVIFLSAIDEYDGKVLAEDSNTDRLVESLNLFEKLTESEWLVSIPFILFLNKVDLFEEKLARKPLESMDHRYPGYTQFVDTFLLDSNNKRVKGNLVQLGLEFFKNMFESRYKGKLESVYTHFTCAIDTEQVRNLFHDIQEEAIMSNLESIGI